MLTLVINFLDTEDEVLLMEKAELANTRANKLLHYADFVIITSVYCPPVVTV